MDTIEPQFQLRVLGFPSLIDASGATPQALGWGKPLALLCLLAVRHEVRRDEVVDLLWRGVEENKARNAFRQALHRLRSAIGDEILPQDRERLKLVRSDRMRIDLDAFDLAVEAGRPEAAVRLYRGGFLEDAVLDEAAFDLWADQERTRVRARFRDVLEVAANSAAAAGKWTDAISYARRLLSVAPFEETAARLAATTLVSAGQRGEARELLIQFSARLNSELGVSLSTDLQAFLDRLGRQQDRATTGGATPAPSMAMATLSFSGRESDLAQLITLWRTTGEDAGALSLIEGDAGIGKTRLTREFAMHARSLGRATVLTGREHVIGAQIPFEILAEALRPLVRATGIVGASKHLLAEAARLLPELRDNLELPPVTDVEDEAARIRFFEGVAALVEAAAYERPILLILEDLQYVAPSSLDLLTYLTTRLAGSAVMFVLTVRPGDAAGAVISRLRALASSSDGRDPPHARRSLRLVMRPLSRADSVRAIESIAQHIGLQPTQTDRIAERSDGVPARLSELLRRASAGEEVVSAPVPIRSLLRERLERLTSVQRRLFLVIALFGRPSSVRIVANAGHVPEGVAQESTDALATEGLVEMADDGLVSAEPLAAEVALEIAGPAGRAFLSGWIAESLAGEPTTHPAELARFFSAAGQAAPAFASARRAGFMALALGARAEASQYFNLARTFASSPRELGDVEGILDALGAGRGRIGSGGVGADVGTARSESPPRNGTVESRAPSRWERWFPNWRMLLGAAIATLLISTFVLWRSPALARGAGRAPSTDTLVVAEGEPPRAFRFVTGDLRTGFTTSPQVELPRARPEWVDSLTRPWSNAIVSPNGQLVAIARVAVGGTDTYVIGAARRDTVAVIRGQGDSRPLGWSPDGRRLLATTSRMLPDGTFDTDLNSFPVDKSRRTIPIDTASRRSVTEAAWSPDGTRIAWVARVGAEKQLEVFVSFADGSAPQNVSRHPADDQHISWSPDGELLAFTSTRDGNAELYAASARENRLWRLTRDPAQDDFAAFSANSRMVAFESTRGGAIGVYVMPALGGEPYRVAANVPLSIVSWQGGRKRFIDRIRVQTLRDLDQGDTTGVVVTAFDQFGDPMAARFADLRALDSSLTVIPPSDSDAGSWAVAARRRGIARVMANVGRWRFDTTEIRIGRESVALVEGTDKGKWIALGEPAPEFESGGAIVVNADREWESGVLSRRSVALLPGLTLTVVMDAPIGSTTDAAMGVSVALVAPEGESSIDRVAPQFLRYVSFGWSADAGRLVYSVGREIFTESAATFSRGEKLRVRLRIEPDSTVSFSLAGRQRWRSTLRAITPRNESRAQVWLGGRATGRTVRLTDVDALLAVRPTTKK